MLEILTLLADQTRQLQPSITGFFWHPVFPKSFQDEGFDVLGLVSELLYWPLIHCVIVPAAIHLEAIETGVLWNGIGDLVQPLVDGLG